MHRIRQGLPAPWMPKAYSYERVSSARQAKGGVGLDRQQDAAARWCQANGHELDDSLQLSDAGASAFSGKHISEGALGEFLARAKEGQLGPDPVLLVEAIDRLSRLEPMDGLRNVIFALADAGVAVITLEDGARYDREALNRDTAALLVLVIKIQSAHEYSQRLSKRVGHAWEKTREAIRNGEIGRPSKAPFWLTWNPEVEQFDVNDRARMLLRMVEIMETGKGYALTCAQLNDEGFSTPTGKPWTAANVRRIVTGPEMTGTYRIGHWEPRVINGRRRQVRTKWELVEGYFPVVVEPERFTALQALIAERDRSGKGPADKCRNIAQGMLFCTCGRRYGMALAGKVKSKGGARASYVRCRSTNDGGACGQGYLKADLLHAHILSRLSLEQLSLLWPGADDAKSALQKELSAVEKLTAQLAMASTKSKKLTAKVAEAAVDDAALALLKTLQDAADDAAEDQERIQQALIGAQNRLAVLQQRPSAGAVAEEIQPLVTELFGAMVRGEDTPEQRWAIHAVLKRLGIRITLDVNGKRCGMQMGDGPVEWQTISYLAGYALQKGLTSVRTETTPEGIAMMSYIPTPEMQKQFEEELRNKPKDELSPEEEEVLRRVFNK